LIGGIHFQDFDVAVGVIFPILDRKSVTNVNIDWASGIVWLGVIGMPARLILDCDGAVSEEQALPGMEAPP
jgi:hypothetical protein